MEAPVNLGSDLCENGYFCLSKALLNSVDDNRSGIEVYNEYFIPFTLVSDDTNLSCLRRSSKMELKVRNTMFKKREPKSDPAFFNFNSHHDINRLSKMLNSEIVIYFSPTSKQVKSVEIHHDFRHLNFSSSRSSATQFFLLTASKELYKCPQSLDHMIMAHNYFFSVHESCFQFKLKTQPGFLESVSQKFEMTPPNFELASLCQISSTTDQLAHFWSQSVVIIVSFCRSLFNLHQSQISRRKETQFSYFITLGVIIPGNDKVISEKLKKQSVKVLCVFASNWCCQLNSKFSEMVINNLIKNTKNKDSPMHNDFLGDFKVPKTEREKAAFIRDEKKRAKKCNNIKKTCTCNICNSTDFNANMSQSGPEQLLTIEMEVREILKLLGQLDDQNEQIIEQMCSLSVASMDIESMTVEADLFSPNLLGAATYNEIGNSYLEDHIKKVQKPIMIAHVDALGMEDSKERILLTAKSDAEESIYHMMVLYWKKVLKLKKKSCAKKRLLAEPLLNLIQEYKNAYFNCCSVHFDELDKLNKQIPDCYEKEKVCAKTLTLAWWQMLPGKLERALNKLIGQYNIFSFYG